MVSSLVNASQPGTGRADVRSGGIRGRRDIQTYPALNQVAWGYWSPANDDLWRGVQGATPRWAAPSACCAATFLHATRMQTSSKLRRHLILSQSGLAIRKLPTRPRVSLLKLRILIEIGTHRYLRLGSQISVPCRYMDPG